MLKFLVILISFSYGQTDIKIHPINSHLLPFQLGQASTIQNTHTFIHYVEINPLIKLLKSSITYYNHINNTLHIPSNISTKFIYKNTLKNLLTHAHYIIQQTHKLKNLTPHTHNKRGLFNFIGTIDKFLIGTLDANDEEKYDTAINNLMSNQNTLKTQIKTQTSLLNDLINNYNDRINKLTKKQLMISGRIQYLEQNFENNLNDINAYIRVQNILDQIILNCQNLINFLDNLENATMFAKLDTVHNSVLPTKNLENMLKTLEKLYNLQKTIKLKDILSYYHIIKVKVSFEQSKIIFAIKFPIINDEKFKII